MLIPCGALSALRQTPPAKGRGGWGHGSETAKASSRCPAGSRAKAAAGFRRPPDGRSNRLPSARLADTSRLHPLLARERQTGDHIDREGTFLLETPRCGRGPALRAGRTLGRAGWDRPPLRSSETEIRSEEAPGVA